MTKAMVTGRNRNELMTTIMRTKRVMRMMKRMGMMRMMRMMRILRMRMKMKMRMVSMISRAVVGLQNLLSPASEKKTNAVIVSRQVL